MEQVMKEMEKGNLSVDEAEAAIQYAGIDKQKAIQEEVNRRVPKNIWDLRRKQLSGI